MLVGAGLGPPLSKPFDVDIDIYDKFSFCANEIKGNPRFPENRDKSDKNV